MPKIKCNCGNIIGLGQIPSPNQLLLISDVKFDKFSGLVDAEDIYSEMTIIAKCTNCGRLHIFWNGFESIPTTYYQELPPFKESSD